MLLAVVVVEKAQAVQHRLVVVEMVVRVLEMEHQEQQTLAVEVVVVVEYCHLHQVLVALAVLA